MSDKKKSNTGKIVLFSLLGVGLVTTLYFVFRKKPTGDAAGGSGAGGAGSGAGGGGGFLNDLSGKLGLDKLFGGGSAPITPTADAGKVFTASAVSEEPGGSYQLIINIAYPRPLASEGKLAKDKWVTLSNFGKYDGDYKIVSIWQDASAAVGAIRLKSNKVTTKIVDGTSFSGIGKITLK
jgi:hypothetical protein